MKKNKILALALALVLLVGAFAGTALATGSGDTAGTEFKFTDVANDSAYADYIYDIYNRGITNGTGESTFSPADNLTRAQFMTFVGRLAGVDTEKYTTCPFTDVTEIYSWAKAYICWAYELGITTGTSETTFHPGNYITREQMATFMFRFADAYGIKLSFSENVAADLDFVSSWATKAVKMFGGTSIDLDENGNFNPITYATREQMAKVLSMFTVPEGGFVLPEEEPATTGNIVTINGAEYTLEAGSSASISLTNKKGVEVKYDGKAFTRIYTEAIADTAVVTITCADDYNSTITGAQLKAALFAFYADGTAVADEYNGVSYSFRLAFPAAGGAMTGSPSKFVTEITIA